MNKEQALIISACWFFRQQSMIENYGGYLGGIARINDHIIMFFNGNGEKYSGPDVEIVTIDNLLPAAEEDVKEHMEFWEIEEPLADIEDYGINIGLLADGLLKATPEEPWAYKML